MFIALFKKDYFMKVNFNNFKKGVKDMKIIRRKISMLLTLVCLIASTNFVSAEAYWSRTAEVRDGTPLPVAVQHALGFVKICAENGVELAVTLPISGNPNRIKWTSSGADIASIQADFRKMQQVPAFQEHFVKGLEMYENPIDDWWISPQ